MNKILLLLTIFGLFSSVTIAQQKAQKPKVMVVPEEAFCINAGMYKKNALGEKVADYKVAMRNDNVLDVINTFDNLMAGYGFNLTNLQQTLDELKEGLHIGYWSICSLDLWFIHSIIIYYSLCWNIFLLIRAVRMTKKRFRKVLRM